MIETWRKDWGQGDFPFYWVQLADFMAERPEPGDSAWAELREAQTMTQDRLPNTGQAVIIDIGEGADIHPRNKLEVARRLARWALARDYDRDIVCQSPRYDSMEKDGDTIVVKLKDVAERPANDRHERGARASPSRVEIDAGFRPRPRSLPRTKSPCAASRCLNRSPFDTRGPTTRSAICTTTSACRSRRSARTTGQV